MNLGCEKQSKVNITRATNDTFYGFVCQLAFTTTSKMQQYICDQSAITFTPKIQAFVFVSKTAKESLNAVIHYQAYVTFTTKILLFFTPL